MSLFIICLIVIGFFQTTYVQYFQYSPGPSNSLVLLQYKHDEFCHEATEKASLAETLLTIERYIYWVWSRKEMQPEFYWWVDDEICVSFYSLQ